MLVSFYRWLEAHNWASPDWILGNIMFRSAMAILFSFLTVLLSGGKVIRSADAAEGRRHAGVL